jgi:membrane-anchored protein YejM (alkaline phosphatase superfamily)
VKAFATSVWQTLRHPQFVILLAAFGISQGVFYALVAQMEKIIISASYVGINRSTDTYIQFTYLVPGILGCVISGALLGALRTHVK